MSSTIIFACLLAAATGALMLMMLRPMTQIAKLTLLATVALFLTAQVVPPAEYDHDYNGELIVLRTTRAAVAEACHSAVTGDRATTLGCAKITGYNKCTVWIASDDQQRGWNYNLVLRHEVAHCNGWKHDEHGKTITPQIIQRRLEEWCDNDPYLLMCNEKRHRAK